ncbi:collagen, type I, alpha 1b-like [Equus asinus]|uniref:collagen, type I, alpha 1b-like n=1 Tax=Equus asinus TaxID=9793 RepID=UPI0038F62D92
MEKPIRQWLHVILDYVWIYTRRFFSFFSFICLFLDVHHNIFPILCRLHHVHHPKTNYSPSPHRHFGIQLHSSTFNKLPSYHFHLGGAGEPEGRNAQTDLQAPPSPIGSHGRDAPGRSFNPKATRRRGFPSPDRALMGKQPGFASAQPPPSLRDLTTHNSARAEEREEAEEEEEEELLLSRLRPALARPRGASGARGPQGAWPQGRKRSAGGGSGSARRGGGSEPHRAGRGGAGRGGAGRQGLPRAGGGAALVRAR